jgi:peptidoglycan/LPS O-acetylase OafA/YrhL
MASAMLKNPGATDRIPEDERPPRADSASPIGPLYFPGLDGLRAVAFAMIYLFHDRDLNLVGRLASWGVVPITLFVDPWLEAAGFRPASFRVQGLLTWPFRVNGWVGVQLFFLLSGFLIATLLLRESNRFGRVDLRAFWVRRALRIWPLYYVVLTLGFGLLFAIPPELDELGPNTRSAVHFPAFLVFLGNFSMALHGPQPPDWISVLWSVCVEEQFYVFAPLLVACVAPRWRIRVVVGLIVAAIVARYAMAARGITGVPLRYNTLANLDTLLAGVLLALAAARWPAILRVTWPWRFAFVIGALGIATIRLGEGNPFRRAVDPVLIWVWAAAFTVLAAASGGCWSAVLRVRWLVWLGKISYGLYMFHEIAIMCVRRLDAHVTPFDDQEIVMALLAPTLTVALAAASYYGYELPFLRIKRRWTRVPSRSMQALDDDHTH